MEVITISGRLGRDAEVKTSKAGKEYLWFSVATSRVDKSTGEQKTQWYTIFSGAVKLAPWLKKGSIVAVSGTPEYNLYISKLNGNTKVNVTVSMAQIDLLHSTKERMVEDAVVVDEEVHKGSLPPHDDEDLPF